MQIQISPKSRVLLFCLAFPAVLASCNAIPGGIPQPTTDTAPVIQTYAAPLAQPTPVLLVSATLPPPVITEPIPTELPRPAMKTEPGLAAGTLSSLGREKQIPCDRVAPGQPIDVTIPDGEQLLPGEAFSKTWRLVNSGECPWKGDYAVVWFSGQPLGVATQQVLSGEVLPGQSVDITVDMLAPQQPGRYQSNWKLRNSGGKLFGMGPKGDAPFWVQIEVLNTSTATSPVEPSEAPTLAVYASGLANMIPNDRLDLDTGAVNLEGEDDLTYEITSQDRLQFLPINGAKLGISGNQEPSESDCGNVPLGVGAIQLNNLQEGVYLCYRTNQGLPGFAHVSQPAPDDPLITLDYVTWTVP